MRKAFKCGVAALLSLAVAAPANAIVIFLDSVIQEGDLFRYNYSGRFSDEEGIRDGSQLVIVDFAGYAGGAQAPVFQGLTFSTGNTALPTYFGYTNDPALTDLIWTYNGPSQDFSGVTFSGLSALSIYGNAEVGSFTATTAKTNGLGAASQGEVGVPSAEAVVPEPAAWAMMIAGFGLVGGSLRRTRGPRRVLA